MITGKNYIGNTLSSKGINTFCAYNAAEFKMLDEVFYCATNEEVDEAVNLASSAFQEYKNISGKKKAIFLESIADEILNLGDELVKTAMSESALPEGRIVGERGRTINQLKMFAQLIREGSWVEATIDTAQPERVPLPKSDLRKLRQAVGPVVVFGASNFPLAFSTAGGDTASALASGCTVIVKSHPSHPGTGELVASAIINAAETTGMPNGVFSYLNDSGFSVGSKLVTHSKIKSVAFTGSFSGGKALYDIANNRNEPIPVFAEMGSTNPVFILPEKMKNESDSLATGLAGSITLSVGQFCTNPGLIVATQNESLSNFILSLSSKIKESTSGKMLNKDIANNYLEKRNKMLTEKGITLEGSSADEEGLGNPTVVSTDASTFISNPNLHEEVFGPFSMIVKCENFNEMISVAEKMEGQLTASFQAEENELERQQNLINIVKDKVGRLIFNGVPTGVEVCSSMQHGGPYPSTTDSRFTSVGTDAIKRFTRPISFQDWPEQLLPDELRNSNPLSIWRLIDNNFSQSKI